MTIVQKIAAALLTAVVLSSTLAQAGKIQDITRLNGRWALDWDQSESFDPAMDALEVPWFLKRLSGVISIYLTLTVEPASCDSCEPRLRIFQENPIKNVTRTVELDGVSRPATDALGNESMDRFTWHPDRGMEMFRERVLKSGKAARIHESRTIADDLDTMISTMTVWIDGEERAKVRRVLVKVE
ncbi:MAG: hypothetical protein ACI8W3_000077 [Myxococcota bacterium]|jgi:hypothetical protein